MLVAWTTGTARGQFLQTALDIGEMSSRYSEIGFAPESGIGNGGMVWPQILRFSNHYRGQGHWIGVRNWTNERGETFDYHVARLGPRPDGSVFFTPVSTRLVAKWEDSEVSVDGAASFREIAIVDEVDPALVADRTITQVFRSVQGVEVEMTAYAWSNEYHDDYHIINRKYTNTGNTDDDDEIELNGQSLQDMYVYNTYRWRGREQAADHGSNAQTWGKFSMVDIVGDGHDTYPVDFTAIYIWHGFDPDFASSSWNNLGSPMVSQRGTNAPSDTIGRLAGMSFQGLIVLHADESTTDRSYNPANQPHTLSWLDSDEVLNADGLSNQDYYQLGILSRENPDVFPGGDSRNYPHYADRVEPSGEFWAPTQNASQGKQGGFAATMAYGPYQLAFGESVNFVEAVVVGGISYDAATQVGRAYKRSGFDDNALIEYDANGNGVIDDVPWDYSVYKNGGERMTKGQWVMTERDSMFQNMYTARRLYEASNGLTQYPVVQPPAPPKTFDVFGRPDKVEISWTTISGQPDPVSWEIYRTSNYEDNLPYELITTLPGSARSYEDLSLVRGIDYYYYMVGVSGPQPIDPEAITGTPEGKPLHSGRYFTQTYQPANLKRSPGATVDAFRIVPNPINLAADETVRFFVGGDALRSQVAFFDIPGNCTISIYSETGEFITRIEHTDGSGDELWNLTTASRQPIVSGVYLVRVVDNESGATDVKKMVVIQ
ncbi:MAG: hypothetical protein R2834_06720 [Rhodothermales bacterium]